MTSWYQKVTSFIGEDRNLVCLFVCALFAVICLLPLIVLTKVVFFEQSWSNLCATVLQADIWILTLRTVGMALIASGTALVLGLPSGLILGSTGGPLTFSSLLFFLPLAIPPYLTAACWQAVLGRNGILPNLVQTLFPLEQSTSWLSGIWGSGIVLGLCYFPLLLYVVLAGTRSVHTELEEAGKVMFSEMKTLWTITLPLIMPHIATGLLLVFILAVTNYAVPALVGWKTVTIKMYSHFAVFHDMAKAATLSLPLVFVCIGIVWGLHSLSRHRRFFFQSPSSGGGSFSIFNVFVVRLAVFILPGTAIAVPLLYLSLQAGGMEMLVIALKQSREAILHSFVLAFFGSFFLAGLAFALGYFAERMPALKTGVGKNALLLPFALPSVLLALGLILVWNRPGLDQIYRSVGILIILWGAKYLPLGQRIVADHIKQMAPTFEEAGALAGLSWRKVFARIVWPINRTGFLIAWGVIYVFALAELGGTLLIIPPGAESLPVQLYNVMHYGSTSIMCAQGVIIVIMALVPPLCMRLAWSRGRLSRAEFKEKGL